MKKVYVTIIVLFFLSLAIFVDTFFRCVDGPCWMPSFLQLIANLASFGVILLPVALLVIWISNKLSK